jgi:hypothetical protein
VRGAVGAQGVSSTTKFVYAIGAVLGALLVVGTRARASTAARRGRWIVSYCALCAIKVASSTSQVCPRLCCVTSIFCICIVFAIYNLFAPALFVLAPKLHNGYSHVLPGRRPLIERARCSRARARDVRRGGGRGGGSRPVFRVLRVPDYSLGRAASTTSGVAKRAHESGVGARRDGRVPQPRAETAGGFGHVMRRQCVLGHMLLLFLCVVRWWVVVRCPCVCMKGHQRKV